jgi:hypothetical protein
MSVKILIVSGDTGCAQSQLPVYNELTREKIDVSIIADKDRSAKAGVVWNKASVECRAIGANSRELEENVKRCDLLFAGSAGTAYRLEASSVKLGNEMGKITVIGSDFWFNHTFPQWIKASPSYWIAIDSTHQNDILRLRPKLDKNRVFVAGQPAFDGLGPLRKRKLQIRKQIRNLYGIKNHETVIVFWSQGSVWRDLMSASFENAVIGLENIGRYISNLVFVPRIHPTISTAYKKKQMQKFGDICRNNNIRMIGGMKLPADELNLSADLVISSFSTASITSALMGIPTVNIMTRPYQIMMKNDFHQKHPFLPTLRAGAAIGVFSKAYIVSGILKALEPSVRKKLYNNAQKFLLSKAAKRIASFLKSLRI